ncbi:carboxypeptidase-like regulatory domain-containing protein [Mucilaginibacter sp. UR6-1]|uniref:carboxypeptidase-like regulatory domain-containing protein n=1 Tax=Mucilaginibacter sp. UR6-1 TaxID=1435643 RepID=UPI001E35A6F9|nr:carboxypeptidase-like regulatory domain-containing protein [Mucilaginibacter sp. UR6-1]MCC8408128.1 carboxypeptidase-like regulatory domain-containing protein [Mucilaginibacter sp. UR6-1]
MMIKYAFTLLLILSCDILYAQVIEGTVADAKTGQPLPYVNIGIAGKATGTVTDDNGRYKIDLKGNTNDTVKISMIGYQPKLLLSSVFSANYQGKAIQLEPDNIKLKEVTVKPKKWKTATLGNTTKSKSSNSGFSSSRLGHELGRIIKIKGSPTFIKRFNASISSGPVDSVKMRLNFYSIKNGIPDQVLQHQNIFVTVRKNDEQISIDLEPYNIYVEDDFLVSLEWIQSARGGVMFSSSFLSGPFIWRETSQARWERVGVGGLGFNVQVEY